MKYSILVILMLFCLNAFAEAYKWVDESGRVHYSDQPPTTSTNSKVIGPTPKTKGSAETGGNTEPSSTAESSESGEPKTTAEREAELKKKQKAGKEAAEKADKDLASKNANQENCDRAQLSLKGLQSGMRIKTLDASGQQTYLDDEQRQQRIERTQKDIEKLCK
jgi:hypothetical protein